MIGFLSEQTRDYTGEELRSLFNYEVYRQKGDSIVAFIGKMDLKDKMIDMEDVIEGDYIYSPKAVNFIVELFHKNIETTVLYQRLLMQIITDCICEFAYFKNKVVREGDDIYYVDKGDKYKMSVSIATVSPISGLIHTGINIDVDDKIPVPAYGLGNIDVKDLIQEIIMRFIEEYTSINCATCKVRTVR